MVCLLGRMLEIDLDIRRALQASKCQSEAHRSDLLRSFNGFLGQGIVILDRFGVRLCFPFLDGNSLPKETIVSLATRELHVDLPNLH